MGDDVDIRAVMTLAAENGDVGVKVNLVPRAKVVYKELSDDLILEYDSDAIDKPSDATSCSVMHYALTTALLDALDGISSTKGLADFDRLLNIGTYEAACEGNSLPSASRNIESFEEHKLAGSSEIPTARAAIMHLITYIARVTNVSKSNDEYLQVLYDVFDRATVLYFAALQWRARQDGVTLQKIGGKKDAQEVIDEWKLKEQDGEPTTIEEWSEIIDKEKLYQWYYTIDKDSSEHIWLREKISNAVFGLLGGESYELRNRVNSVRDWIDLYREGFRRQEEEAARERARARAAAMQQYFDEMDDRGVIQRLDPGALTRLEPGTNAVLPGSMAMRCIGAAFGTHDVDLVPSYIAGRRFLVLRDVNRPPVESLLKEFDTELNKFVYASTDKRKRAPTAHENIDYFERLALLSRRQAHGSAAAYIAFIASPEQQASDSYLLAMYDDVIDRATHLYLAALEWRLRQDGKGETLQEDVGPKKSMNDVRRTQRSYEWYYKVAYEESRLFIWLKRKLSALILQIHRNAFMQNQIAAMRRGGAAVDRMLDADSVMTKMSGHEEIMAPLRKIVGAFANMERYDMENRVSYMARVSLESQLRELYDGRGDSRYDGRGGTAARQLEYLNRFSRQYS